MTEVAKPFFKYRLKRFLRRRRVKKASLDGGGIAHDDDDDDDDDDASDHNTFTTLMDVYREGRLRAEYDRHCNRGHHTNHDQAFTTWWNRKQHKNHNHNDNDDDDDDDEGRLRLVDREERFPYSFVARYLEQLQRPVAEDLTMDWMELLIQFGYVTMFAVAFPLGAIFCFVNNLIEIRVVRRI